MNNIAQALAHAQTLGIARLDAQLLLLHALGKSPTHRAWLATHDADLLPVATQSTLEAYFSRSACGEPLAYITGYKEFYGLQLCVDARVLVPRADTEILVDWVLDVLSAPSHTAPCVLDLGTGSGAIALALKHTRVHWHVHAVDASADALEVAQHNARALNLEINFTRGIWLNGLHTKFHAIVSNPPYIAYQDPHLYGLRHEPLQALTSGIDGLDDIRSIITQAPAYLHPAGWLLLEHGYNQAAQVRALLSGAGFFHVQSRRDLAGIERCSGGQFQSR